MQGKDFLDMTPKTQVTKEKNRQTGLMKFFKFSAMKDNEQSEKANSTGGGENSHKSHI